jgi:N-acetyl-1-D-myo-inositol-2-amino-2-deoxy-alpha-D-glucopyranoside deacetylase
VSVAPELRLMTVHAHADDESITMGGLLAKCADRGIETCNVCCTDGKLATIFDPSMPEETTRPRLVEIRQQELREACKILGVTEVEFLGYGDSGMAGAPTNDSPDAFWKTPIHEATGRVVEQIRRFRPHVVATYDANGGYGHPDHIQTHRATLLAVEAAQLPSMYPDSGTPWRVQKLYYTAFPKAQWRRMKEMATAAGIDMPFGDFDPEQAEFLAPDDWVTTTIDCSAQAARKREAMLAHHSQIQPDWPLINLPDQIAGLFATEYYILALSRKPAVLPEDDVFAGVDAT